MVDKPSRLIIVLLFFIVFPSALNAQFLNIQIDVEPEVEVAVQDPLNFGSVIINSGYVSIPPGSPGMGTFRIRALNTQQMFIEVEYPEFLIHSSPNISDRIPIDLVASYNNNGVDDVQDSQPVNPAGEAITIIPPPDSPNSNWSALLVYIYGGITVGNVRNGAYYGEITLTIIYD